jgi:hypothetical protein
MFAKNPVFSKKKMLQDSNMCLEIFQFLHLDEWFHFLYLNKLYYLLLKSKILPFVARMGKIRLNNLIESETQMNLEEFWKRVRNVNGQVTGSIHLQVLLGKNKFKSHDMDIFIMENEIDKSKRENHTKNYSGLHQFLFQHATGMVSDNNFLTDKQRQSADKNIHLPNLEIADDLHIIQKEYESACIVEEVGNIYHIKNVYTYKMMKKSRNKLPRLNIQVIALQYPEQQNVDPYKFVSNYIRNRFDFSISTSMYNGHTYKLCNVIDVYNRNLQLSEDYKLRMMFFCESQETSHKKRVRKYTKRHFKCDELVYGEYLKLLCKDNRTIGDFNCRRIKISLQDFVSSHNISNKRQKIA